MTSIALHTRRRHQRRITRLLAELEQRRQRLYVLQARGARPAGLRDLKAELHELRDELAAAVDDAGRHDDLVPSPREARWAHAVAD
jgi:hypothetical protein